MDKVRCLINYTRKAEDESEYVVGTESVSLGDKDKLVVFCKNNIENERLRQLQEKLHKVDIIETGKINIPNDIGHVEVIEFKNKDNLELEFKGGCTYKMISNFHNYFEGLYDKDDKVVLFHESIRVVKS